MCLIYPLLTQGQHPLIRKMRKKGRLLPVRCGFTVALTGEKDTKNKF
jgi:hypothetical protein